MHASNIGLATARFDIGILLAVFAGGVVGAATVFARGGGASSAARRSVRDREVIAAMRHRQPNVRIMAEQLAWRVWREYVRCKAYRPSDDGGRVWVRISAGAHLPRDVQTHAECALNWEEFPRRK